MEYLLAYGLMAVVIAALAVLNGVKTRPVHEAADRFGLLFLEARAYALDAGQELPLVDPAPEGAVRLRPAAEQGSAVRAALAAGAGAAMTDYDARLEQALRDMFQAIGGSGHLKTHFFDYFNNLYTLHRLFMEVCAAPESALSQENWEELQRYWGDGTRMTGLVAQRLSAQGRKVLAGEQPRRKEGIV